MSQENGQITHLISPAELTIWVPGQVMSASDELGWKDVGFRLYDYQGQDVEVPAMDTFMIVQYVLGETPMDRKVEDGRWTRTLCKPGNFSLLSRGAESHWNWTSQIEVNHVYLTSTFLARVATDIQDKEVAKVDLYDVVHGSDPIVTHVAKEIAREAIQRGVGGPLYVEALAIQLSVQLLRKYATCVYKISSDLGGRFSERAVALLEDYIEAHLQEGVTLDEMAQVLGMGVWTFNRHLRHTLGCSAYAFVVEKRIRRAQSLLRSGNMALKEIAASCGFSDQAHMTRMFRAKLGVTPGEYRKSL